MRCNLIHSNENNDIITATIQPNIVAMKSSLLNSESHNSLTNPHRTEMFVPMIEYGITLEILPTKHNIKVTDNAIVDSYHIYKSLFNTYRIRLQMLCT